MTECKTIYGTFNVDRCQAWIQGVDIKKRVGCQQCPLPKSDQSLYCQLHDRLIKQGHAVQTIPPNTKGLVVNTTDAWSIDIDTLFKDALTKVKELTDVMTRPSQVPIVDQHIQEIQALKNSMHLANDKYKNLHERFEKLWDRVKILKGCTDVYIVEDDFSTRESPDIKGNFTDEDHKLSVEQIKTTIRNKGYPLWQPDVPMHAIKIRCHVVVPSNLLLNFKFGALIREMLVSVKYKLPVDAILDFPSVHDVISLPNI